MEKIVLAYDLGTGGNKASLFTVKGKCLASAFLGYPTDYPLSGWHEQRPTDWWNAVVHSTRMMLGDSNVNVNDIVAIGVSGHSLGCVPIDKNGNLLREATPIWSDCRPVEQAKRFFEKYEELKWYRKTGNGFPAPHYPLFKLQWFKENEPQMFERIDKVLGTKDYINYLLTGVIATDHSYASGSGVYNLLNWQYDEELLDVSGLDPSIFPNIVPSTEVLGPLRQEVAELLGLPQSVVVVAGGVDNSCMAAGARNTAPGRLYASLGSSSWIAVSDTKPLLDDKTRPYVFAHIVPGMFTSAIGMFSSGTTFRWIRDNFFQQAVETAAEKGVSVFDALIYLATQSPIGSNRLMLNPCFAGGSSLEPSPNIRGALLGLDLSHTPADVIRATLEGIAMNMRLILDGLRSLSDLNDMMSVVGGGSLSPTWRQIYADALRIKVEKTNIGQNAASLGAAACAAIGVGLVSSFEKIDLIQTVESVEEPDPENAEKYDQLLILFKEARDFLAKWGDSWTELDNVFQASTVSFD
ncbi:MAG: xylulokinase [Thermoguttaceae bacterium]